MAINRDFPENFRTYETLVAEMLWFIEVKNDVELTHCIILTKGHTCYVIFNSFSEVQQSNKNYTSYIILCIPRGSKLHLVMKMLNLMPLFYSMISRENKNKIKSIDKGKALFKWQ